MARYRRLEVLNTVVEIGVMPLFYQKDRQAAKKILDACAAGGARVVEFTNRGDGALEIFRELELYAAEYHPQLILGVGSVPDSATAALYIQEGANFIVAPFIDEETAFLCNGRKIPYLPGCATLSEMHRAEKLGVEICKIFPGDEEKGPQFIKAVRGPCPWSLLMPTGGVSPTEASLGAWIDAGACCVGLGSRLIPGNIAETGAYGEITKKLAFSVKFIAARRSP